MRDIRQTSQIIEVRQKQIFTNEDNKEQLNSIIKLLERVVDKKTDTINLYGKERNMTARESQKMMDEFLRRAAQSFLNN